MIVRIKCNFYLYIGPPYLELKIKMPAKQVGSNVEAECVPTEGNPTAISSEYSYLLCFKPVLATNHEIKNFHLAGCSDECCLLYSSRKVIKKLEIFHRGNYWCRVEHESKDPKMERNSTVQQIDVECTSCNVRKLYYTVYTLQDIGFCQTNLNILNDTYYPNKT